MAAFFLKVKRTTEFVLLLHGTKFSAEQVEAFNCSTKLEDLCPSEVRDLLLRLYSCLRICC